MGGKGGGEEGKKTKREKSNELTQKGLIPWITSLGRGKEKTKSRMKGQRPEVVLYYLVSWPKVPLPNTHNIHRNT